VYIFILPPPPFKKGKRGKENGKQGKYGKRGGI